MDYKLSHFGATGWPLVVTANAMDNPFLTAPDGVELFRKALWAYLGGDPEQLGERALKVLFHYLFLKDEDVIKVSTPKADPLVAVIRKASAYFKQKYTPVDARRPWNLTRLQFYTLPHTVEWGRGSKGQQVKVYTDPSGTVTRNFPDFWTAKEVVDEMYRRAQRWAYEKGELDD